MVHLILVFGPYNNFLTKLMLCNFFKIINFIIYIEGSMKIFIMYIGIIGPQFRFDCTNFRASLIIIIINFNKFFKMVHLAMLVIFYVDVISCQNFNLPHIYSIFVEKTHFLKCKLVTWYPNMVHIM
jgi:hypothetical protein